MANKPLPMKPQLNRTAGPLLSGGLTIGELIRRANLPRELIPTFEKARIECFQMAQKVYDDRTIGYNADHPCYEEQVYGPLSLASEVYKRSRRLAALLSPIRTGTLRPADVNRMLDICVDTINYLTWTYALISIASGFNGHADSDDAPDYTGNLTGTKYATSTEEDPNES